MATGVTGATMVAPKAFATVEPGLFRSAVFGRECFGFVRHLNLKTVAYLASEEPPKPFRDFCNDEEIEFLNLGTMQPHTRGGDWNPLGGDLAKAALEIVLNGAKYPLMIMCLNGVNQTGALIGCLRTLQTWSFASIVEEHRRFCDGHQKPLIENYIEEFDVDLVSFPKVMPDWFVSDLEMIRSEEAEIRRSRRRSSSASRLPPAPSPPLPNVTKGNTGSRRSSKS